MGERGVGRHQRPPQVAVVPAQDGAHPSASDLAEFVVAVVGEVDVVGDALSVLVITKLPFAVPNDPVFSARSELFREPFVALRQPDRARSLLPLVHLGIARQPVVLARTFPNGIPTVGEVLALTQYDLNELAKRMKAQFDTAIKQDRLRPNEGMRLLQDFERGLKDQTYLTFD